MNQAENFKVKDMIFRIFIFIIYFIASGFSGKILAVMLNSFMQAALRSNPELKSMILYIISLLAVISFLFVFSLREGYADTQELRYSIFKAFICYFLSGAVFFILIVCADIYIFEQDNFFKEHFIQPYYIEQNINNFPGNYIVSAAFVLFNAASMLSAYKIGRARWIAEKKKKLQAKK